MNIVRAKNFEISKVNLTDIKVNSYGGKNIYLNYDGAKNPLYFKLPKMKMTFNAQVWKDENNEKAVPKHSIVLSFHDLDSNKSMKECYDKLKALDLFIGTEDDDGSAAKPSKSGSIDKTFGGLSLFDTADKGKEKPKASDVDDLFSMTSNDDGNASGGGSIDSSFDFSSYIQNNS